LIDSKVFDIIKSSKERGAEMSVDIVSLIVILLFPVGLVLGFCEEPRINYDEARKILEEEFKKRYIDN
jgi:hypothetical protein